ncbi:MAG: tail fiber protein [Candidatus Acidiferrales bacterium]|jgi:microcystin-dependent protein
MAQVFLGSLMLVPYTRVPTGFAFCQGQLLPIAQNTALFSLLGTTYGGDGRTTFGLPNLQGSLGVGQGQKPGYSNYPIGSKGGTPTVTLNSQQVPSHTHQALGTDAAGDSAAPTGNALAKPSDNTTIYTTNTTPLVQMQSQSVQLYGNGGPHNNMMPFTTLNWIIALQGIFPPRS